MTKPSPLKSSAPFVFFGAGPIAAAALIAMETAGSLPSLVVTLPDRPAGRGKVMTETPVAAWSKVRGIRILKPETLDEAFLQILREETEKIGAKAFAVVDYGKILPKALLDIPEKGVLNMHPSLLPRLRGPSPIRSAILNDEKHTGVTVMLVDEKMDHGPLMAQKPVPVESWPPRGRDLDALLAKEGGLLLASMLPLWIRGEVDAREQNHDVATYTAMFSKEDGLLDLEGEAHANLLKIRAFEGWPGTHAFVVKNGKTLRLQILDAHVEGKKLVLDRVKPEGKNEMSFADFSR